MDFLGERGEGRGVLGTALSTQLTRGPWHSVLTLPKEVGAFEQEKSQPHSQRPAMLRTEKTFEAKTRVVSF